METSRQQAVGATKTGGDATLREALRSTHIIDREPNKSFTFVRHEVRGSRRDSGALRVVQKRLHSSPGCADHRSGRGRYAPVFDGELCQARWRLVLMQPCGL